MIYQSSFCSLQTLYFSYWSMVQTCILKAIQALNRMHGSTKQLLAHSFFSICSIPTASHGLSIFAACAQFICWFKVWKYTLSDCQHPRIAYTPLFSLILSYPSQAITPPADCLPYWELMGSSKGLTLVAQVSQASARFSIPLINTNRRCFFGLRSSPPNCTYLLHQPLPRLGLPY